MGDVGRPPLSIVYKKSKMIAPQTLEASEGLSDKVLRDSVKFSSIGKCPVASVPTIDGRMIRAAVPLEIVGVPGNIDRKNLVAYTNIENVPIFVVKQPTFSAVLLNVNQCG
ncbi:MAG TPA: hypothetical protein ENI63_00145 [Candidatus Kaiserbacteria bacterium]|nr:hypothetical protein [Candidatus Kaiserbacteria bacterium]